LSARTVGGAAGLDYHVTPSYDETGIIPNGCLAGRPEKRQHSLQFGSHPGNPGYCAFFVF
jgi:hypothetical protein